MTIQPTQPTQMNGLPAVLMRPAAVLPDPPERTTPASITRPLDDGVPARLALSSDLTLILSVGIGRARALMEADPGAGLVTLGVSDSGAAGPVDVERLAARLTLIQGATLGESTPVVVGQTTTLGIGGRALVSLQVQQLTVTVGSLLGPGRYGSTIAFWWTDLRPASSSGPVLPIGDASIPARPARTLRLAPVLRGLGR